MPAAPSKRSLVLGIFVAVSAMFVLIVVVYLVSNTGRQEPAPIPPNAAVMVAPRGR